MAKDNDYTVQAFFQINSIPENKNGKTYRERIDPQLVPTDEFFGNEKYGNISREEWTRKHEEKALSALYGAAVKVS